jgi:uncharacterized delta-60 repeat protein
MAILAKTKVPRSLGVNKNTGTTRYTLSGEQLSMLSGSLTAIQNNVAITLGDENTTFAGNLGSGFNGYVYVTATQDDGRIVVGGGFDYLNGNARNYITRINPDGTEDYSFYQSLGGFNSSVNALAIQPDGKILVGGNFNTFNGNTRNRLVRLNNIEDIPFYTNLGDGFNGQVLSIIVQPDGKILIGGSFTDLNGHTRNRLVRLNPDGTEDTDFYTNLGGGFNGSVNVLAIQPDGKILVGGDFDTFNSNTRRKIVRLNPDGTEDTAFYLNTGGGGGGINKGKSVITIAIQPDGKVILGGSIEELASNTRYNLIRLHPDGKEDIDFYTNLGSGFNSATQIVKVQPDGKILVGGDFDIFNGNGRNRLVQLFSDATEDTTFYGNLGSGFNSSVYTINNKGNLLVGGDFTDFDGNSRNYLVDLTGTVPNINNVTVDATSAFGTTTGEFNIQGKTQISNTYIEGQASGLEYKYTIPYEGVNGELAFWGEGTVVAGKIYYLNSSFQWVLTKANATSESTNMLAIAAGSGDATQVGMLLRGHARFGISPYTLTTTGAPLYLDAVTGGYFTETAPVGSGEIVRIIGYVQKADNYQIYFCPDNIWVENL